jgi:integrase
MQPLNNNGSIIIRFQKFKYEYKLGKLGKYDDKQARYKAGEICQAIETDINLGRFSAKDNDELFKAYHPLVNLANFHDENQQAINLLDLVNKKLSESEYRKPSLYQCQKYLVAYGKEIKNSTQALDFFRYLCSNRKRSPNTTNRYLNELKAVCPYFVDIDKLKGKQTKEEKAFTKSEIKTICDEFDVKFHHYSAFVKFLFSTGVRTNEAVALTWDCVDFEAKTITIKDSIGVSNIDGSKVRKSTKTEVSRVIPMSFKLEAMLKAQRLTIFGSRSSYTTINLDSLVFPSPKGCFIDISNFRDRFWVKVLTTVGVPYRTLYNTRHTFCSHFLNETPDFIKLASLTHGTKSGVQTLIKHYAHLVSDISMPEMF